MAKIIKLDLDEDYYYRRGIEYSEEGRFVEAADSFRSALDLEPDSYYACSELAYAYMQLGLTDMAIKYYAKTVFLDRKSDVGYMGLMQCFMEKKDTEAAMQAVFSGIRERALPYDAASFGSLSTMKTELMEFDDTLSDADKVYVPPEERDTDERFGTGEDEGEESDSPWEKKRAIRVPASDEHRTKRLRLAHFYEITGRHAKAQKIIEDVTLRDPRYPDRHVYKAMVALYNDELAKATAETTKALDRDPDNMAAIALLLRVLSRSQDGAAEKDLVAIQQHMIACVLRMEELKPRDRSEALNVALAYLELDNDDLILKHYTDLIAYSPYDRDTALVFAQCLYNKGLHDRSDKLMLDLRKLYPDDTVIAYYARIIKNRSAERIIPSSLLPLEESDKRVNRIEKVFSELGDVDKIARRLNRDPELNEAVRWVIDSQLTEPSAYVGSFLCQHSSWQRYIADKLVDPAVSTTVKREFLVTYLRYSSSKDFVLYAYDRVYCFYPALPKCADNPEMRDAYWTAYGEMAFFGRDFAAKLNGVYVDLVGKMSEPGFKSFRIRSEVMAAVLAYLTDPMLLFGKIGDCCKIFDCSPRTFRDYLARLDIGEKKQASLGELTKKFD